MPLPTLQEFFADWTNERGMHKYPFASYINHPDFQDLYVRRSPLYIEHNNVKSKVDKVATIANVTAYTTGKGSFSRLLLEIFADTDCSCVYVECVLAEDLKPKLIHLGFKQVPNTLPACYILWRGEYDPVSTTEKPI